MSNENKQPDERAAKIAENHAVMRWQGDGRTGEEFAAFRAGYCAGRADEARATAPQAALTDGLRKLIQAAADCISESVTYEQDGFDTPPMPATQWDYNAEQIAYALRAELATPPTERMSDAEDAARYRWLRRQAIAVKNYAGGNPNWEVDWALRGESFEAAIDAARKAESERSGESDA